MVNNDGTNSSTTTVIPTNSISICFLPQYLLYRDPDIFGPNASTFVPNRWHPNTCTQEMIDAVSMTFSLGPRSCLEKPLAMEKINYLLPRLLLRYSLHLESEGCADYRVIMKYSHALIRVKALDSRTEPNPIVKEAAAAEVGQKETGPPISHLTSSSISIIPSPIDNDHRRTTTAIRILRKLFYLYTTIAVIGRRVLLSNHHIDTQQDVICIVTLKLLQLTS